MGGRLSNLLYETDRQVRQATRRTKSRVREWEASTFNTFQAFAYLPYESDDECLPKEFQSRILYYETRLDRHRRPFDVTIDVNTQVDLSPFFGAESHFVMKKFEFMESSWIAVRARDRTLRPIAQRAIVFDIMRRAYTGHWNTGCDGVMGQHGDTITNGRGQDYTPMEGPRHIIVIQGVRSQELWVCHRLAEPLGANAPPQKLLTSRSLSMVPESQLSSGVEPKECSKPRSRSLATALSDIINATHRRDTEKIEPVPWIPMLRGMVELVDDIKEKCQSASMRAKRLSSALRDADISRALSDHIMTTVRKSSWDGTNWKAAQQTYR
ncbi:hypothetical protein FOL47_000550 [Perkinsus chesapeaki]|uniref:Uncharacterized protein n=1 Tax=Perkinsus chesapeaki TaxID=330153 RepID=A0A7J6N162_PERCH|nr:hypothetical protein FOL47_000550 [Perkinsus chesapeaki]